MLTVDEEFLCPYCASKNLVTLDLSGENQQKIITDCETCCKPITIIAVKQGTKITELRVQQENN